MSSPSSSTRPVLQPFSDSSCIRFSVRRKVDLPQPDGPIKACTRWAVNLRDTPLTAVNLPYMAVSLSVSIRAGAGAPGAGASGATRGAATRTGAPLASLTAGSAIEVEPLPDGEPGAQTQHQHDQDQHQGRGPGVPMPLVVGAGRVGEHGEGQRRHRLVEPVAQVLAAERGEE